MHKLPAEIMVIFRNALERHEQAVQSFLIHPSQHNGEKMAIAFQEAQELRLAIKRYIRQSEALLKEP